MSTIKARSSKYIAAEVKLHHFHNEEGVGVLAVIRNLLRFSDSPDSEFMIATLEETLSEN